MDLFYAVFSSLVYSLAPFNTHCLAQNMQFRVGQSGLCTAAPGQAWKATTATRIALCWAAAAAGGEPCGMDRWPELCFKVSWHSEPPSWCCHQGTGHTPILQQEPSSLGRALAFARLGLRGPETCSHLMLLMCSSSRKGKKEKKKGRRKIHREALHYPPPHTPTPGICGFFN